MMDDIIHHRYITVKLVKNLGLTSIWEVIENGTKEKLCLLYGGYGGTGAKATAGDRGVPPHGNCPY